ncbi:hypothetical protein KVR01_008706 [Diaporthe batatas]|uniref:uncharacterized protein n=1 Tax=Diaporthe batatas TaxID=748121 RepID=UPI001D036CE8|nr:uncharacterized protein KVR01_008706 [Diaporthe batatas]KAG8161719.1 hypothetical protein KVR01_008706 [Diaporthe batatas]
MAPIQSKPELPVSHAGVTPQTLGSATTSAADEKTDETQQPSLSSTREVTSSPSLLIPRGSRPSLQLGHVGLKIGSSGRPKHKKQPSQLHLDANHGVGVATRPMSPPGRSSGAPSTIAPMARSTGGTSVNDAKILLSPGLAGQKTNSKRKAADTASGPNKKPRLSDSRPDPPGGDDSPEPSEASVESDEAPSKRPLCDLREIIEAMMRIARSIGLSHFLGNGRPYYIRVGTVCSGTDAPIHVMEMFSMFRDEEGNHVFQVSNEFACEIEWWKQSFLKRNSKPKRLFRDARDFSQGDSEKARLVTGAEAAIPAVDFFIAGTSCVDFSSLNTNKTREFAGLKKAQEKWAELKRIHGDKLSYEHLSPDDWRSAIDSMNAENERKNQSEQTFAGAINYIKCRQPKVVVCENVDSAPWQKLVDNGIFQLMGYSATVLRLDTKQFYMPQTRVRKYLILFSHRAFTLAGAQALSNMFRGILPQLEHTHSNSVLDFLFPINSHELQKARNEVESDAQGSRERETDWSISKDRHAAYRRKHILPRIHLWMQWDLSGHANTPVTMWKPWASRMPLRILDVMECFYLHGLYGRSIRRGPYDIRYKAQVIDNSQNVDRIAFEIKFGRTGCLTPNAIPVITLEARPIIGAESLRLQGLPVENFDMSVETQAQLQDLAGNAMTTTVVGGVILAALTAIARVADKEGYDWLEHIFHPGDFKPLAEILNSFHHDAANVDHGPQIPLLLKLYAHSVPMNTDSYPQTAVQDILDLAKRVRRRCPCHHILSYSSVELYVCTVCGVSHCKSCKGNPEHVLARSKQTLEDINFVPYAQAEYEFRKCFPAILWMQSPTATLVEKLDNALRSSTCDSSQRHELAKAMIDGLCNSIYQLQFVEITDVVRLEYVGGANFRLRVLVEEDEVTWSLHLDQYCSTSDLLVSVLPKGEPIARAILGREETNLFPDSQVWEFWIPGHVSFPLEFELQEEQALSLAKIGDLDNVPEDTKQEIRGLEGSLWEFHPECGFPEYALWVHQADQRKYFLFKDVDPIGAADQDAFVITTVSREMGRRAPMETRPVLLRISKEDQIHRHIKDVLLDHEPFLVDPGHKIPVLGSVGGRWAQFGNFAINFTSFPNMEYDDVETIAKAAPTCIRQTGGQSHAKRYEASCDQFQSLLTTSLPILGNDEQVIKIEETLKTLDLTKPLDVAELTKLIGPLYSAVEMGLVGVGKRVVLIQENVELSSDCHSCAPRIPEVFYVVKTSDNAGASKVKGPVVARHRAVDQQNYELNLQSKPRLLHIDHNVTSQSPFDHLKLKRDNFRYVDVCFLAHGHALLHQARAHLPQHPSHFEDTTCTTGTFAMEVAVIENPRTVLSTPIISAPSPVRLEDSTLPLGFQGGLQLFKEQSDSLQWMLSREPVHEPEPFMEIETAEVHLEQLRMRVHADAKRPVYRRGRVVADDVGFGKTAVCLGLIDVQRGTDRKEFMDMRKQNQHLHGLVHLQATLIIVPNQLTYQWQSEAKRFLGTKRYNIVVITTFAELQKLSIAMLKKADIVICSNKVFLDNKYHSEMSAYCSPNDVDKIQTMQKVYRAWYKQFQRTLEKVRDEVVKILELGKVVKAEMADLTDKLDQIRADLAKLDDDEQLAFAPAYHNKMRQYRGGKTSAWRPQILLEIFSWSRVIWDEFPYENIPVTEFVANCATTSKWMLSGTPPLNTLGDACKAAYLFNVHIARPLQLIKGRQPPICENEPLAPHSDLESTGLFQSRPSLKALKERHQQLLSFVSCFMRKNHRETDVAKIELPVVLTMSPIARLAYAELQIELQSRQYNANNVGTECRRRLMSRIDWKGKESGRDRSVEALTIRASASVDDVLEQSGLVGLPDIEAARGLLSNTDEEIHGIEDRGRELLGKAIFLAYRLTFITLSNAKDELDGQDERHLDYYQSLVEIVESVLNMDMSVFQSWDAFSSAMRILIWPEPMRQALGDFKTEPNELRSVLRLTFEHMRICETPTIQPRAVVQSRKTPVRELYEKNHKYFDIFRDWITKTPLHTRRWFLIDHVDQFHPAEEELLHLEWSQKLTWDRGHDDSERGHSGFVLPHKLEEPPSRDPNPDQFDLAHLKSLDIARRQKLSSDVESENPVVKDAMKLITARKDCKDTKAFWEEECNRRGLIVKAIAKKEEIRARVARDIAKTATDEDYISPESCGVTLADFPQEGKRKFRGSFMEVIFDSLMQVLGDLTDVLERSVVVHARRNLQSLVVEVLGGTWACHNEQCGSDLDAHFVSLTCGHVFCGKPDDKQPCGVGLCQRSVNNVCIPLSELRNSERVITASGISGAITSDPVRYLDADPDYKGSTKGPKARAIINLIRRIRDADQVVVFVQTATMETEIYRELAAANIKHVTAAMLVKSEAGSLEAFKDGKHKVLVQTVNSEQAAGSNLHNANHVIFVSPLVSRQQADWDSQMRQALGRCVRFRQAKKVYVYHMLMDETAEVDTLEWRMKREVVMAGGQAVGRFSDCATKDFLGRYEGDETAAPVRMAPGEGRAHSILPRDDVQYLMGDDQLSLAAIKALRTIDESIADKGVVEGENDEEVDQVNPEAYLEPSYIDEQRRNAIARARARAARGEASAGEAEEELVIPMDAEPDRDDEEQDAPMAEAGDE